MFNEALYEHDEDRIKGDLASLGEYLRNRFEGDKLVFILDGLRKLVAANIPVKYIIAHSFAKFSEISIYEVDYGRSGFTYADLSANNRPVPKRFSEQFSSFLNHIDTHLGRGVSICFFGYNSSGKSHAATYLLAKAVEAGFSGYYIDMATLYEKFNSARWNKGVEGGFVRFLLNCDVLVIDELGKEPKTEAAVHAFEQILKIRASSGKSTIMCTNLDLVDRVDSSTKKRVSKLRQRYGNSVYEAFVEHVFMFQFSRDGEFRASKRKRWSDL